MLRRERTRGFASFTHFPGFFNCRGYHIMGIIQGSRIFIRCRMRLHVQSTQFMPLINNMGS